MCTGVQLVLGLFPLIPEPVGMGTFSFLFSTHPAPPIAGYLQLLSTGHGPSRRLGSSCCPSAPSPSYLRNGPGSRKAVTEQRLVGGREKPVKSDSTHWLTELSLLWDTDVWSGTQSWGPSTSSDMPMFWMYLCYNLKKVSILECLLFCSVAVNHAHRNGHVDSCLLK